jgi:hypothetical protein
MCSKTVEAVFVMRRVVATVGMTGETFNKD